MAEQPTSPSPRFPAVPIYNPDVCVKFISPEKGRGVFAMKDFQAGDIVEVCPVVVIEKDALPHILACSIKDYYYWWTLTDTSPKEPTSFAVVLGYGMIYNHNPHANCDYDTNFDNNTMSYRCIRPIKQGDEITVNYHGIVDDEEPFDHNGHVLTN
ncbi:putative lysine methyltransferase [Paratrimastix pyriformis]|uniref:Lysine methyltransferase n=1 Tax=Paratrimastix pyriformis TaxID=342808 RepID=A0ABQ8UKB3_9EUKA|nr:putative lysine methyltransferase [Paratrimastix pyriformis]